MPRWRFCECPIRSQVVWREHPGRCWRCRGKIMTDMMVEPEKEPCPDCGKLDRVTSLGGIHFWCGGCLLTYRAPGGEYREIENVRTKEGLL